MHTLASSSRADEEAQLLGGERASQIDEVLPLHLQRRWGKGLRSFLHGPQRPRIHTIQPIFPSLQSMPLKLLASVKIDNGTWLAGMLLFWLVVFSISLTSQLPVKDAAGEYVVNLDCVDTLWKRNNDCGLDGLDCRPFNNRTFAFRCPAKCGDVRVLNPHHVGPVDVNYRPLVIGAGPYRGDSFICGSALHAGIVDDAKGGCGRVTFSGKHYDFASTTQNGIESITFDSYFPLSLSLETDENFECSKDPRSMLLLVSLFYTTALAIFSTSAQIFFPIFVIIFAHVSFVSDPPQASHLNITVLPDHISMFTKRLLPAMFIAVVVHRTTIKRTLTGLTAQFEKALLWLGGFWIGALSNYTFDWIPLARLDAHDLQQQPGAKFALATIIIILVVIIVGQAYAFWLEGRLFRYLGLYGIFITAILLCLAIPGVNLRIHHYILALLLLPGTSMQTRLSLLYQGVLLGLFVNGVARWDFDSVLQTSEVLRGDALLESSVPVSYLPNITAGAEILVATFQWRAPAMSYDGISVLVNDVERSRIFFNDEQDWTLKKFQWERPPNTDHNEYFRWAFMKNGRTLDYSKAATLFANGTWLPESDQ
ncbi:hypothetical protein EK21DRAFT_83111 [Setomelanomma holmii]|uniref:LCCL domain-containing protein n=1 Tax=Setomelanomma holmii TaxID=210430 RepID=A0A9P4GW22_9PLEO|nr:hypothetical protein EK21DRAFT_83111 [Setomelanomma holmii]